MTTKAPRLQAWQKAIAVNHLNGKQNNSFHYEKFIDAVREIGLGSWEEIVEQMKLGITIREAYEYAKYKGGVSTTSLLYNGLFDYTTESYKKAVIKGFKILLNA